MLGVALDVTVGGVNVAETNVADVKQILCIKWGTLYGPKYVNHIYGMVSRNITPPFKVVCFTDDRDGIRPEVECHDLPELGCPVPTNVPGKFRKVALWNKDLFGLTGVGLYVDLDVVITGSLDDLFEFADPGDVVMARDTTRPAELSGQSSVVRFPIGGHGYLLDRFRADPEALAAEFRYEQRFISYNVEGGVKFFPPSWVRHFRHDCLGPWPLRYIRPAELPEDARVILFPQKPDPEDAMLGRWSEQSKPSHPALHLLRALMPWARRDSFGRHLKRYLKPVKWIEKHWRE